MAYDERLFERIRDALERKRGWTEKPAFGGRAYVLKGKPFIGVVDNGLVVLCNEEVLLKHRGLRHCTPFAHNGKLQPGWLLVNREALKTAKQLSRWVDSAFHHVSTAND